MTSMKMWYLLLLAAVLSIVPTVAEVVKSVSDCDQFLLNKTPPDVTSILEGKKMDENRYKFICQTYDNKRRFLTLYDTKNKIPVYSAYKYTGGTEKGPFKRPKWKIEPQLEGKTNEKMMCNADDNTIYVKQAGIKDYKTKEGFNKGHLIPYSYGSTTSDKKSTCTLTNIVPQAITFNGGSWSTMEMCVKCVMDKYCKINNGGTKAYVVTGAIPNDRNKQLNKKINIPDKLWSAFCCYSPEEKKWIASAHWGENVPENESEEKNEKYVKIETLEELLNKLKVDVFPGKECPRHTKISFTQNLTTAHAPPLLKPLLPVPCNICPFHHNIWSTISSPA
ncbi:endonuclease domain-containing 1 protein-like [Micropterus salmoides]|uniref:endonuclease domain-containing 1 protein-like n=1 Tax=Micropterus salmoides TaxID=27706 RepID=UPI0018EB152A|nr:endonuclease domain-containing 1 protein-like [Micropterus salmoides]